MNNYEELELRKNISVDFKDNARMIGICNNIKNIDVYYVVKLAYELGFIYPHIEEISLSADYNEAKQKLKQRIIINQINYYNIIESCKDEKVKKQIIALDMNEKNLNIARIIATAKDQFRAYNIRRAYTEYYIDIPEEFNEGIGLPVPTKEIWYVAPDEHIKYMKMLKKD